jgi:hypothetical protein
LEGKEKGGKGGKWEGRKRVGRERRREGRKGRRCKTNERKEKLKRSGSWA